jgi:hypothetical protein
VADVDPVIEVEFGEDVVVAGRRVDLRRDLPVCQRARDRIGLAQLALDLDEKVCIAGSWRRPPLH